VRLDAEHAARLDPRFAAASLPGEGRDNALVEANRKSRSE
jgi:hypothetical protein